MVGSIRPLAPWLLVLGLGLGGAPRASVPARAEPPEAPSAPEPGRAGGRGTPEALLGDAPQPFVPLHPRTVEDRRRLEALQAFAAARALEDRRDLPAAIDELKKALDKDPGSVAILRRLSRLCFTLGRAEQAVSYSRKAVEADPNDAATLRRLVQYYERKNDLDSIEATLTGVLAHPGLDRQSVVYLLCQRDLGVLYATRLQQAGRDERKARAMLQKSADAFAQLIEALDDKAANELSQSELRQILPDEADNYGSFGLVLQQAKRYDRAIKAYQRGLAYEPNNLRLLYQLAEAQLSAGRPQEALATAEQFLEKEPRKREGYELKARCLAALHREGEIIPWLERAVEAHPESRSIQFVLADRYSQAGRRDKANALFDQLRNSPSTPQEYNTLADWLRKEKKAEELLKLLGEIRTRGGRGNANAGPLEGVIRAQAEAIAADRAFAEQVLEAAREMMAAEPPTLSRESLGIVTAIAAGLKKPEKIVPLLRLAIRRDPNFPTYLELAQILRRAKRFDEAQGALDEGLDKFPAQKSWEVLALRGEIQTEAGQKDEAVKTLHEALKLEPNSPEALYGISIALSKAGADDEAIDLGRRLLKMMDPKNPELNKLYLGLLALAGRDKQIIEHCKSLLEQYPRDEELEKVARLNLSNAYVNLEDYAKGEAELEILYQKNPDDEGVNNDLGYLYAEQGKNLEKAEAMVRKALEESHENSAYLDSLGWVLFKRGKVKEALGPLEKAVAASDPETGDHDGTIHDHLGDVYFRLQEYAKARSAWEEAAKRAAKAKHGEKRQAEIRKKLQSLKELEPSPRAATGDSP